MRLACSLPERDPAPQTKTSDVQAEIDPAREEMQSLMSVARGLAMAMFNEELDSVTLKNVDRLASHCLIGNNRARRQEYFGRLVEAGLFVETTANRKGERRYIPVIEAENKIADIFPASPPPPSRGPRPPAAGCIATNPYTPEDK